MAAATVSAQNCRSAKRKEAPGQKAWDFRTCIEGGQTCWDRNVWESFSAVPLACYLNCTDKNVAIDCVKAAADFGSANVDSFKKMIQNSFKKVDAAQAKATTGAPPTPPKVTPANGARKRKAAAEVDDKEGEDTLKHNAKRGGKAKTASPTAEGGDEAEREAVARRRDSRRSVGAKRRLRLRRPMTERPPSRRRTATKTSL